MRCFLLIYLMQHLLTQNLMAQNAPQHSEINTQVQENDETDAKVTNSQSPIFISLHLGIGKEWLQAKGGISEYKGAANIGGTNLRGEWESLASPWMLATEISAHNFTTEVSEEVGASTPTEKTESKFLRLYGRAAAFYDLRWDPGEIKSYQWRVGLGLSLFRLPILEITETDTGAADLTLRSGFGPYLGLTYIRNLSRNQDIGIDIGYVPMVLGKISKGKSIMVLMNWRYGFVPALYTVLGLSGRRESLTIPVDCPDVNLCIEDSEVTSQLVHGRMGLGYRF